MSNEETRKRYDTTGIAETKSDINKSRMLEFLANMLLQIIDDERTNIDNFDIVKIMKDTVSNNINLTNVEINKVKSRISKREKAISKIVLLNGDENFLSNVLLTDSVKQQQILTNLNNSLTELNAMLVLLNNYKYNIMGLLTTNITHYSYTIVAG